MQNSVLLLDDDPLSLEFMKIFLEQEGFTVFTATSCSKARELFSAHEPRTIVVDLQLEDGSGIDFAKFAKSLSNVKVVLASGHSKEFINKGGANSSVLDVILTKPIELSELRLAVQAD